MNIKLPLLLTSVLLSMTATAGFVNPSNYGTVHYVSVSGDDANAGTQSNPFATITQAVNAAQSGDAISIAGGDYSLAHHGDGRYDLKTGLDNLGKNIDFFGNAGKTVINIHNAEGSVGPRDLHFYSGSGFSRVYDLTFVRDSANRSTNYSNAIFGWSSKGEFHNTVFKSVNTGSIGMTYDNNYNIAVKVFNSVFDIDNNTSFAPSYTGASANTVIENSASNIAFHTSDGNTYRNNASSVTFDESYHIVSPQGANESAGVYGGQNAWAVSDVSAPFALGMFALAGFGVAQRRKNAR
jgi:hypothetical protein